MGNESGQAVVELAFTLTLLLVILAGAVDLGRAFFGYISIVNAAREGARVGAALQSASAVTAAARNELDGSGLDPNQLAVSYTWGGQFGPLVVTVSYPYRFIMGGFLPAAQITLSSSATMMIQ